MIPFQEYDLRQMLENQFLSVNKKNRFYVE